MSASMLLTNVRPAGRASTTVLVRDGRIAAIGPNVTADNVETIDGAGVLMSPASSRLTPTSTRRSTA